MGTFKMNDDELKKVIRCLHALYYNGTMLQDASIFLKFHRHLQELFNYAEITDTLVSNNPDEVSPEMVDFGIKQGWIK
jgi:hypothetical protein